MKQNSRLLLEGLRLKASRVELAGERQRPLEIALHGLEFAHVATRESAHEFAQHFRARLPDERRGARGFVAVRPRLASLVEVKAAEADHRSVRHLNSAKTVLPAQRYALAEIAERRTHPALSIGCIGEAAERASFRLGRA